jgi:uncharacterized cupin superfamily protein
MASVSQHTAMASGITVNTNPNPAQLQSLGVTSWPTWGRGVSTFPWSYDEQETCLLLEGEVTVTPDGGEPVRFGAGDLVVFDAGLSCTWVSSAVVGLDPDAGLIVASGPTPSGLAALPRWRLR